jgi:PBSX family phage terminase large subunit
MAVRLDQLIAPPFYALYHDIKKEQHAEYWLKGGRGSTKSSFISIMIVLGLLSDPQASAIIYRKVAATLRESVYAQMLWAIEQLGVSQYFVSGVSPLEIKTRNGAQKIVFRGLDDPGKSKSIKLAHGYFKYLWFEELDEFDGMESIRTVKASVVRGRGKTTMLCSYNPPRSARNWVNVESMTHRTDRRVHESNYTQVPPEWLGESFINDAEMLRKTDERAYRHMYLGEVTGTGGAVFENLTIRPISEEETKSFGAVYMGLDFGWYPDPAHYVAVAYHPAQRRVYVYDEFRAYKRSNYELYTDLVQRGVTADYEVIADSAEKKSVNDLRTYGLRCTGATKGAGSVRTSMRWLQSRAEIVIDPVRCPHTAKEFAEYEYERGRDGTVLDSYPDKDNHAIDAVRYALNRVWMQKGA